MLKTALSLLSILIYYSSLSQVCSVVDRDGNPVPYATIEAPKKNVAFFADVNGRTNLFSSGIMETDTLTVSAIGFNSRKIAVKNISDTLVLERQVKELQEVFVYNGKWKAENWGSKKKPRQFNCSWRLNGPGCQMGRIITPIDANKKPAFIYKISFYTVRAKKSHTPVRLRIYSIDEKGLPGKDILQESMIENLAEGDGWLDFDLTDHEIKLPEKGLIVAAEFFDTTGKNWNREKITFVDSSGKKEKKIDVWYGGHFATDDETNQGETLRRYSGYWYRNSLVPSKHSECINLVVRVWVKYPEPKN